MSRGADPQREHEYEKLKDEFHEQHRYLGREEEVAARIVNKQRAMHGETKDAQAADRDGESPDRSLPIKDYDKLDIDEIKPQLEHLSREKIEAVKAYECGHANRKTLVEAIESML